MIARVWAEIHPDVVDALPVTLIRIEEDEVSDANLREVLNLDPCIRDSNDSRGGFVDFKGAPRYGATGFQGVQSEWHRIRITTPRQVVTIAPNHANIT